MRIFTAPPRILVTTFILAGLSSPASAEECLNPGAIGTSREIIIPSPAGARPISLKSGRRIKLRRKELILTIDDGPHPIYTPIILNTLRAHCLKATFFMVGEMAMQSPQLVREVYRQGHTVATHTWGHPRSLPRLDHNVAMAEIERGMEAVDDALSLEPGSPRSAPLFRFPGLNESSRLILSLNAMGISSVTVDIDPRDWEHKNAEKLLAATLRKIRRGGRGVLLLHDIKSATAAMLPRLLRILKARGYRFAHLTPNIATRPPMMMAQIRKAQPPTKPIPYKAIGLRPSIVSDDVTAQSQQRENEDNLDPYYEFRAKAGI